MCGISGAITNNIIDSNQLEKTLKHRGPDHYGSYVDNLSSEKVYLFHNRLSILDLSSSGNQPMKSDDKNIIIVFNGEIYNFLRLKEKYLKNEKFKSHSDTEVIIKLYQKFGISFIEKLNGDFAIALYDKLQGKFFLIRDRVGVKPLYYYHQGRELYFSSEIKGIFDFGFKKELAVEKLQRYFIFKYSPGDETLFKNIIRLKPGHFIEFDTNIAKFEIHKYWEPEFIPEYASLNYREACKTMRELLEDASKIRLIADVPIANFLSGGIDSSIISFLISGRKDIIHYCAKKSEDDLKKEGSSSDFNFADQLATKLNLNFKTINIGKDELTESMLNKVNYFCDDLIADGSLIPSYLITNALTGSAKVILSGMGADEIFFGYASHQLVYLMNILDKLPFGKYLASHFAELNQGKGFFLPYRRFLHKMGKYYDYPNYKYGLISVVGDYENSMRIINQKDDDTIDFIKSYFPSDKDVYTSLFRFEFENFLVKNLTYTDRMSMANSVETRVPYLDHRIVNFAFSLAANFKISGGGKTKRIVKDAFKSSIPRQIIKRRKAGFGMPLRSIFSSSDIVKKFIDMDFLANFNIFNLKAIERIVEYNSNGKEDHSQLIFALIAFQSWYKTHFNN